MAMARRLNPQADLYIPQHHSQIQLQTHQNLHNPPQLQMFYLSSHYNNYHNHNHNFQTTPLFTYSHPCFSHQSPLPPPPHYDRTVGNQHHGHDQAAMVNRTTNPRASRHYYYYNSNSSNDKNGRGSCTTSIRKRSSYCSKQKPKRVYVVKNDDSSTSQRANSHLSDLWNDVDTNTTTTTLMIRNIPSKYTRVMLMEFMDEYCKLENEANCASGEIHAYDFLYLPIDFRTKMNKGYAFVNFTTKEAASKFEEKTKDQKWPHFNSNKIRKFAKAVIQGREGMLNNYENMKFDCTEPEFLPVLFDPARDGANRDLVKSRNVGIFFGN